MPIYLNRSPALRTFKSLLGHANHLIITALVGLDAIERRIVTDVPKELHAAWSPKNPVASARRGRRLLLDMALLRAVDALDVYVRRSNRKPFLIENNDLRNAIDAASRSVTKKFQAVRDCYTLDGVLSALVESMIIWRNKSAHEETDTELSGVLKNELMKHRRDIAQEFCGLDAQLLIKGFEGDKPPRFKEIASFINATHHFANALDIAQLRTCDPERYLKEHVWMKAGEGIEGSQKSAERAMKARFQSVWGRDVSERAAYVKRFLTRTGLSFSPPSEKEEEEDVSEFRPLDLKPRLVFQDNLVEHLCGLKVSEAYNWAKSGKAVDSGTVS